MPFLPLRRGSAPGVLEGLPGVGDAVRGSCGRGWPWAQGGGRGGRCGVRVGSQRGRPARFRAGLCWGLQAVWPSAERCRWPQGHVASLQGVATALREEPHAGTAGAGRGSPQLPLHKENPELAPSGASEVCPRPRVRLPCGLASPWGGVLTAQERGCDWQGAGRVQVLGGMEPGVGCGGTPSGSSGGGSQCPPAGEEVWVGVGSQEVRWGPPALAPRETVEEAAVSVGLGPRAGEV